MLFRSGEVSTEANAPGTYNISTNFSLSIEPLSDVEPGTSVEHANHIAAIDWVINDGTDKPTITFTFTPTDAATLDQKDNGVISQFYFITSANLAGSEMTYAGSSIFKFDATKDRPETINKKGTGESAWTKNDNGTFTYTIEDASQYIQLGETFYVDTLEDWNTFNAAIAGNIVVFITDSVTDVSTGA